MLENTEQSTSEIANVCGYPSLQYMYAVFKKHFDKTPREYRDEAKGVTPEANDLNTTDITLDESE